MRLLKIFFLYFVLIIYSLEILLFLSIPNEQKSMIKIHEERIKIAKQNNLKIDLRSPDQFYLAQKKKNKNLDPKFLYAKPFSTFEVFKDAKKNNTLIPFRGPINKLSISCAEDLTYNLYNNDKYGFKNSNKIYEKKINSILLGDSYAEGLCVFNDEDIAGNLNRENIATVNFGVTGTGPLISLAILKEFGEHLNPKNTFYLYFEGNDLDDLNFEKKEENLIKYLKPNFKENYINRYDEIELFLEIAKKESENKIKNIKNLDASQIDQKSSIENFKSHFKDIIEINNLKNIIRFSILRQQKQTYDLNLFYSIIEKMNYETKKWNGNYFFVYVPTWSRYFTKYTSEDATIKLKEEIIKKLVDKKIKIIDLTEYFDNSEDIKKYFPLGYIGHYNARGYSKIAEIIKENIN